MYSRVVVIRVLMANTIPDEGFPAAMRPGAWRNVLAAMAFACDDGGWMRQPIDRSHAAYRSVPTVLYIIPCLLGSSRCRTRRDKWQLHGGQRRDPQGQRLGDRLAQTQVIEGLGAKDLVKSFQDWLSSLGVAVGRSLGRRGRGPVE